MHISESEEYRMQKEHKMRNGYSSQDNKRFPHDMQNDNEVAHKVVYQDTENKHAMEQKR